MDPTRKPARGVSEAHALLYSISLSLEPFVVHFHHLHQPLWVPLYFDAHFCCRQLLVFFIVLPFLIPLALTLRSHPNLVAAPEATISSIVFLLMLSCLYTHKGPERNQEPFRKHVLWCHHSRLAA